MTGCPRVLIGGAPAARIGDTLTCIGPPDTITEGEPTVLIGEHPQGQCLKAAAAEGTPFVEMGE